MSDKVTSARTANKIAWVYALFGKKAALKYNEYLLRKGK